MRPSASVISGHILLLVEDLCRSIIPLFFLQPNSSSLYAVIFLQVYFPQLQKHAVVLHNTTRNYNATPNRDGFFCANLLKEITKKSFLHIYSRLQYWNITKYINSCLFFPLISEGNIVLTQVILKIVNTFYRINRYLKYILLIIFLFFY